jgi:hypothetical protein
MNSRCEAMIGKRAYSLPGRCLIGHNVKPVYVYDGPERMRVKFCAAHRKITAGNRRVDVAR